MHQLFRGGIVIKALVVRETAGIFSYERLLETNLFKVIAEYDESVFLGFQRQDYEQIEHLLTEFCFELLDFSDDEQVFIARTFFVSQITELTRTLNRKKRLKPRTISFSYHIISTIEKWENISEYILSVSWLIRQIREKIIEDFVPTTNSPHVEEAMRLIDSNLTEDQLSVKWVAEKLNISTTHLGNLFKLTVGETVSNFITKSKLNEIIFEMTYTGKSLQEIREKYGFHNHSHFIQYFKKHLGTTPLKYKQQIMEKV